MSTIADIFQYVTQQHVGIAQLQQQLEELREENARLKKEAEQHGKTVVSAAEAAA